MERTSSQNDTEYSLNSKIYELQSILAFTPGNVYWKNKEGIYLGCNNNFARLLKLEKDSDIEGKSDYDFLEKEKASKIQENDLLVIKNGKEITLEELGKNSDGTDAIYLTRKIPRYNESQEIIGILGISIDITERKLAEEREKQALAEAAEAERAKAKAEQDLRQAVMVLTGSIAHDLRTPISMIEMQGGIIQEYWPIFANAYQQATNNKLSIEGDRPDLEFKLKHIAKIGNNFQETARQMHEFIDVTLKSLSKVLSNELTQEDLVTCTMWRCLHNSIERYPFSNEEKKLIHKNTSHSFEFMGNEVLIIRVLYNLLKNSLEQIKKQGKGEIFISTEETENANLLRFKDTAGGAPAEVVEHLFDGYRTTKAGGTGVGLAFCKLTMKSFGGDITCNSVYGEYIEFVLRFPKLV